MPIYYAKNIEATTVGAQIVGVRCDKCDTEYFYELARVGTARVSSPYGIGAEGAAQTAQERSEEDLQERLAHEAELVPCPKCNWINDELVRGYRLGRYRRMGLFALLVTLVGIPCCFMVAWCLWIGPAADRGALPYVLLGGPVLVIGLSLMLILLRNWLRSWIQPNRRYPAAPQLPPGTPPAMLFDDASGQLQAAKPREDIESDWHEFQIGRHAFPPVCCVCMQSASTEHAYEHLLPGGTKLQIPRCADCARRDSREYSRIWWITVATTLLIGGGVMALFVHDRLFFWILFAADVLVSLGIGTCVAFRKARPVGLTVADASRGILQLHFRNPEFRPIESSQEVEIES